MYKFDDNFLESVGLGSMPAEQKDAFLQYAQDQLEMKIGEKMSEGLSNEQLDEFERLSTTTRRLSTDGLLALATIRTMLFIRS